MATTGQRIIDKARTYLGVRYVLGGNGYSGIDCSGLTQQSYRTVDVELPRYSQDQGRRGVQVGQANARPGELVFWTSPEHVAIYLGSGRIIEAVPNAGVREGPLWGNYTFRKIYPDDPTPPQEEDIMASIDDLRNVIRQEVPGSVLGARLGSSGPTVGVALQTQIAKDSAVNTLNMKLGSSGPTVAVALQTEIVNSVVTRLTPIIQEAVADAVASE